MSTHQNRSIFYHLCRTFLFKSTTDRCQLLWNWHISSLILSFTGVSGYCLSNLKDKVHILYHIKMVFQQPTGISSVLICCWTLPPDWLTSVGIQCCAALASKSAHIPWGQRRCIDLTNWKSALTWTQPYIFKSKFSASSGFLMVLDNSCVVTY